MNDLGLDELYERYDMGEAIVRERIERLSRKIID